MPHVHRDVDALAGCGEEGARGAGDAKLVGGDNDEKWMLRERVERLTTEGVALDHFDVERQSKTAGVEQGDQRPRVDAAELDPGEIVVALAIARIDRVVVRAIPLDHLPERREGVAGERLGAEDAPLRQGAGSTAVLAAVPPPI